MNTNDYIAMMRKAKASLAGNWGTAAVGSLIIYLLLALSSCTYVVELLLYGPLMFGYLIFLLCLFDTKRGDFNLLFVGFNRFVDTMVAGLLLSLGISIGFALLIVPGVIISLGFGMAFFIMADNKEISGIDALKKSWEITNGHKMELFMLNLRFFGWIILACLTCGIGFLWLAPYMYAANLNFYRRLVYGTF